MYECKHCNGTWKREVNFLKHECEQMIRHRNASTPIGKQAYFMYSTWLEMKNNARTPTMQMFLDSRAYPAFVRAAKFLRAVRVADVDLYIKMAVENDYQPSMWTMDAVYSRYLNYLMRVITPREQIRITVNTIIELADIFECELSEVFSNLSAGEVAQLIREQKLTPWLLLFSNQFRELLVKSTPDVQQMFNDLIRPMYWKMQFERRPDDVVYAKKVIDEMDI